MSASCSIDKNRLEYQTLKDMSGISDFELDTFVYPYYEKNGRFPELDEIPRANSVKHLKDKLQIKDQKELSFTDIQTVLKYTNSTDIEKSVVILNNKFRDLEIEITPISETCLVDIKKRPSKYNIITPQEIEIDTTMSYIKSRNVMNNILGKLNRLYGTDFIYGTTSELCSIIPEASTSKAFVYNNKIYINTDLATIDSSIHELLHIFLGSMRYTDPDFYFRTVSQARNFSNFNSIAELYPNRTMLDVCEEVFVEEFAKYLSGIDSNINELDYPIISKLIYNINRTLDSALMGNYSVQSCDSENTLIELAEATQSKIMNGNYFGKISRQTSNLKSNLLKSGELKEECL